MLYFLSTVLSPVLFFLIPLYVEKRLKEYNPKKMGYIFGKELKRKRNNIFLLKHRNTINYVSITMAFLVFFIMLLTGNRP
ncbi:MAG: hypothetical protein ACTSUT_10605 [Promethearchaeota archaeon]